MKLRFLYSNFCSPSSSRFAVSSPSFLPSFLACGRGKRHSRPNPKVGRSVGRARPTKNRKGEERARGIQVKGRPPQAEEGVNEGHRRNYASVCRGRPKRGAETAQTDRLTDGRTGRISRAEQRPLSQSFVFPLAAAAAAATSAPPLSPAIAFFATLEIRQSAAASAAAKGTHGDRRQMRIGPPTGERAAKTFIYNTQRRRRSIGRHSGFCSVLRLLQHRRSCAVSVAARPMSKVWFLRARFRFGRRRPWAEMALWRARAVLNRVRVELGGSVEERARRRRRQAARS